MKTKWQVGDTIALSVIAAMFALTAYFYPRFPESFPTHFDLNGEVDADGPKAMAWLVPALTALCWGVIRAVLLLLPKEKRERVGAAAISLIGAAFTVPLAAIDLEQLHTALFSGHFAFAPMTVGLALFLIVMGQTLPRLQRNGLVGIRIPSTLRSDENWARTHRFGGYAMTLAGLAMIPLAFVSTAAAVLVFGGAMIAPLVFSVRLAHRLAEPRS